MILNNIHAPYTNLVNLSFDSPNFVMFKSSLDHYKNSSRNGFNFSYYSAINLPDIGTPSSIDSNIIKFDRIDGAHNAGLSTDTPYPANVSKDLAQSIQNYINNLEAALVSWDSYDSSDMKTPSENIWWKWLVEIGAIRFQSVDGEILEQSVDDYNKVVRYTSTIAVEGISAAPSSQTNEVYILMGAGSSSINGVFKSEDSNSYFHNLVVDYVDDDNPSTAILGHDPGITDAGLIKTPFFDKASVTGTITNSPFDSNSLNTYYTGSSLEDVSDTTLTRGADSWKRSNLSCISLDLSESSSVDRYTGNDIEFNAIMIYYQVYDEDTDSYVNNLFGVYFLNPMETTSSGAALGRIVKSSTNKYLGSTGSGYGIRVMFQHYVDNVSQPVVNVTYDNDNAFSLSLYHRSLELMRNLGFAIENLNKYNSEINERLITIEQSLNGADISDIQNRLNQIQYDYNTYSGSNIVSIINSLTDSLGNVVSHLENTPVVSIQSISNNTSQVQITGGSYRTINHYDIDGASDKLEISSADISASNIFLNGSTKTVIYDDVFVSYPTIVNINDIYPAHRTTFTIDIVGSITISNGSSVSFVDGYNNTILHLSSTTQGKRYTIVYNSNRWVVLD